MLSEAAAPLSVDSNDGVLLRNTKRNTAAFQLRTLTAEGGNVHRLKRHKAGKDKKLTTGYRFPIVKYNRNLSYDIIIQLILHFSRKNPPASF